MFNLIPRLVLFVAFPGMGLLDLTGPQTAFWAASEYMDERRFRSYERHTVSMHGGLVEAVEGVSLMTRPISDFDGRQIDTIIIPGSPDIETALAFMPDLANWIREAAGRTRRTASVCTGAFFLAEAGLLADKRATTHWSMCERLQQSYPTIEVESRAIYVQQGNIWSSAGVTSGIDLSLAMIEEDCGRAASMHIAKLLVLFLKRPGNQPQHSEVLLAQAKESDAFDRLHLWLHENIGNSDMDVNLLADRMRMSPRNFSRVYKQKTGRTPAKTVELFRLEAAQRLLKTSPRNLDQIASECGFVDAGQMRATFQRNLGVTPSDYRKQFISV